MSRDNPPKKKKKELNEVSFERFPTLIRTIKTSMKSVVRN
jgi:hypothetical protein